MAWATVSLPPAPTAHKPQRRIFPRRSLAGKLTLAFFSMGVIGMIIFVLLVGQRTRSEFNRFLSTRDQAILVDALGNYYVTRGTWEGVRGVLANSPPLDFFSRNAILTDATGVVVIGNPDHLAGQTVPSAELMLSTPITAGRRTVGYVLFTPMAARGEPPGDGPGGAPGASVFLQRVLWPVVTSAGITALLALVLGGVLAQTLTRPVSELTAATEAMAAGNLHQQVTVRSHDEIGQLADSFNQMSADLARASQLRKQMTADLAHDLRTPLAILRGYMEGLKEGRLQGSETLYALMYDEVEYLRRLIDDLRVLSLVDAGELSLNRRMVDPMALLERTGLAYMVQAETQGIALRVEPTAGLPSIAVDTDRMTQVLNNLVSNALRYTAQGEIVLAAASQDGRVILTVHDTGAGIAAADLPFVFDRFYRGDKARQRTDSTSSGLGLAIAKALVEAHGGTLTVASSLGQGTTFTISLPSAREPTLEVGP